jgi:predicted HAD superfamily Cof-like phosphohydrolase
MSTQPTSQFYQSDFQKVVNFNNQFGVKLYTTPQFDICESEPNNVEFCLKLIREEVKELHEAIDNKDFIETVDALADILYVVYGMGARIGTNMDYMFNLCIKAMGSTDNVENMDISKLDYSLNGSTHKDTITTFQNVLNNLSSFKDVKGMEEFKFVKTNVATFNSNQMDNVMISVDSIDKTMKQLEASVIKKDYLEILICLCGIMASSYTMSAILGVDMDYAFDIVHENNMSKLCSNGEEAINTVLHYMAKKELGYDSPACRLGPDNKHWVVFNESTKKILKSIKWKEVDLNIMFNN